MRTGSTEKDGYTLPLQHILLMYTEIGWMNLKLTMRGCEDTARGQDQETMRCGMALCCQTDDSVLIVRVREDGGDALPMLGSATVDGRSKARITHKHIFSGRVSWPMKAWWVFMERSTDEVSGKRDTIAD